MASAGMRNCTNQDGLKGKAYAGRRAFGRPGDCVLSCNTNRWKRLPGSGLPTLYGLTQARAIESGLGNVADSGT